jgi:medium-chain acyl-[acyl-carrier-protein] hydrolase
MPVSSRTDKTMVNRWVDSYKPNTEASLRLFCFPYAGGSALIYRKWADQLPSNVEVCPVQLPGRGARLREAPFTNLVPLVERAAVELAPLLDKPFVFFGHSMGAMISFELARRLRSDHRVEPAHLFVSGRRAPRIPIEDAITYNLPAPEFIEELKRLNGTPREVLEHPELMQLMMPILRADFEISQTYRYQASSPLTCPITAIGGIQDDEVPREYLQAWRDETASSFKLRMLPGDHFFLQTSESLLLGILSRELQDITNKPHP